MFSGGLETETEYSYKGEDEKCEFIKKDVKVYINSSLNISSDESGLLTEYRIHPFKRPGRLENC